MKILTVLTLLVFSSCADDSTYCFKCSVAEAGQVEEFTRCGITQDEADDIERAGTEIDTRYSVGFVLKKNTICNRAD